MNNHNFEKLGVWQRSLQLAIDVCAESRKVEEFALRDQLQRSSISIPSNIAEGAERLTVPDFVRFLGYGKGSCGELRTQLLVHEGVCAKLGMTPMTGTEKMISETHELSKMIHGLIKTVQA